MAQLLEKRIARVRRGLLITGGIFAGLNGLVAVKHLLADRALQAEGAGPVHFSFLSTAIMVGGCFLAAWILSLQYASRVRRTIHEGKLVIGRIAGEPGVWGNAMLPQSDSPPWRLLRMAWETLMHLFSGILPTLTIRCEIEGAGKKHFFFSAFFKGEEPVQADTGEVLVLAVPGKLTRWPGPWIIALDADDPDRSQWLIQLDELIPPAQPTEAEATCSTEQS